MDGIPIDSSFLSPQQMILIKYFEFFEWIDTLSDEDKPSEEVSEDYDALMEWYDVYQHKMKQKYKGESEKKDQSKVLGGINY